MRRIARITLIIFILIGLTVASSGCGSEPGEAEAAETHIATVGRGDLSVEITAAGNLALSTTEDLAIDLFYPEGTLEEVLVEEGDIVAEGQVLTSLDTEEWEDELEKLQDKLTEAERGLTVKERALVQAERKVIDLEREVADAEDDVTKAGRQVTAKEVAVSQAQLNLDTAEYNLSEIDEVEEAQDAVDEAEDNLRLIKMVKRDKLEGLGDFDYWNELEVKAEAALDEAEEELQDILDGISITVSGDVALEVAEKQLLVEQKQLALEDAQIAVDDAEKAVADAKYALEEAKLDVEEARHDVEDAQLDVADAEKALLNAQEKLEEANSKSPLITAPFDGFITKVNVEGGDDVMTGTVAVQLADPDKFEADIYVSEMDIMQVEMGGEAWVQVDAISGLTLPATVTHISPTATIQSGVVNYKVKVEVASLEEMIQERQTARQEAMQKIEQGELPERLQQAIEAGQITQEQAEEMMKQMQQSPGVPPGQLPSALFEGPQLREGLSVTVTIVVEQATDVLLVPNASITGQGGQSYVQVVSPDGTTEQRAIQTGISDWQYTEITGGLSEGEQIIVPEGTTVMPTTQQRPPGGFMPIPGMGRPPR